MTLEEAQEIVDKYAMWWPFTRMTPEAIAKLKEAQQVVDDQKKQDWNSDNPAPF